MAQRGQGQQVEALVTDQHGGVRHLGEPAEPVGERRRLLGALRDHRREPSRRDRDAGRRVVQRDVVAQVDAAPRSAVGDDRRDPQDVDDPARTDVGAGEAVDHLGGRAQRGDQERGQAVEHHQVADVDGALDDEPRTEPGDEHDEDAGQQHLRGVECRLDPGHPDAGGAHQLRAVPVALDEGVLAADAAQHPQAGDRVGAELVSLPGLVTLGRWRVCNGWTSRRGGDEHRHADEDDEAERRRGAEQDERRRRRSDDRSGESALPRRRPTDAHRVGLTVATTSPVGTARVSASPVSAALWPMSWATRNAPCIQFVTASRCRITPAPA